MGHGFSAFLPSWFLSQVSTSTRQCYCATNASETECHLYTRMLVSWNVCTVQRINCRGRTLLWTGFASTRPLILCFYCYTVMVTNFKFNFKSFHEREDIADRATRLYCEWRKRFRENRVYFGNSTCTSIASTGMLWLNLHMYGTILWDTKEKYRAFHLT